jgi:hypothetical protein
MSIMTRLFPHKALQSALSRIGELERGSESLHRRLVQSERTILSLESAIASKDARIRLQKEEIMRLTKIVNNAHPRDPKTGRIMGKGSAQ